MSKSVVVRDPESRARKPVQVKLNVVDKALAFLSPELGVRRYAARIQEANAYDLAASWGYVAGRSDKPSTQEWHPSAASANEDFLGQSETIRARSRDLVRNSPIASAASNTATTNVVGTGLRLHARVDREVLGLTDEEAQTKQREIERMWRMVRHRLDFEGDANQTDLQAMVFRGVFESGDILPIRRRDLRPGDLIPLKVQLVEADRISNPRGGMDTDAISGGVEVNARGVTVAYHVADRHPGDFSLFPGNTSWTRVAKDGRGGIPMSKLVFDKRRPGQRRGVPSLAAVVEPLKQISRLTDYELTAAVVSSLFTVFIKTETPVSAGLPSAPEGTPIAQQPTRTGDVFLNPGSAIDLLPGESIETANPNRPNGAYDPFFRSMVQQIGAAIEIPYEVLMHLYQSSYSASKAAMLDAWRFFKGRRQWLVDNFLSMVYEWVLMDAVLEGLIDLPGFLTDPIARHAWLGANWVGDAMGAIHETEAAKAAAARVDGGFSDRAYETAALLGRDWDSDVQPQRESEKRRLEAAGMPFAAEGSARSAEVSNNGSDAGPPAGPDDSNDDPDSEEEAA